MKKQTTIDTTIACHLKTVVMKKDVDFMIEPSNLFIITGQATCIM